MNEDQLMIEQLKTGSQTAFSRLINDHQNYVYSICYGILKDGFEAEEATQDTFLKFYRAASKIDLKVKMRTFLYKIAYRTSLDYIRKRKRVETLEHAQYKNNNEETADNVLQEDDQKRYLREAMSELKPDESALVTMFYFKDLSIKEIAEITGMSLSNIKIKLMRSRTKLAKIIDSRYQFIKQ